MVDLREDGVTGEGIASAPRRKSLALVGKAGWTLLDQMLSALTNMVLAVLVVKSAGASAFDAFAVAFLLFSTLIGITRALVNLPLATRHSAETAAQQPRTVARATGVTLAATIPFALVMAGVGVVLGGTLGAALVTTAVVLPFLILQDTCRLVFFSYSKSHLAALNDFLWALVQFPAMALIIVAGEANATSLILAWGGSAAVCVAVALRQLRAVPDVRTATGWLREHRDMVGYRIGDFLLTTGSFNGGYLTIGAFLGDAAVGSIRAAQVLVGPLLIVQSAAMSFGLPELGKRMSSLSRRRRRDIALAGLVGMLLVGLAYTGVLLLLPDSLGTLVFDDKWAQARDVLLPMALASVAAAAAFGPALVVYAMGQAKRAFRLMTVEAPLVFFLLLLGTWLGGVRGAAWGQLADGLLIIWLWLWTLHKALAERDADDGSPDEAPARAGHPSSEGGSS